MTDWRRAWSKIWPFLVVAAVIASRNSPALFRAEFWCEDASDHFAGAMTLGWHSLYQPASGFQYPLSRLIALLASAFPVIAAPYVYSWSTLAIDAFAVGYFSLDRFAWLIPQRGLRVLACVLLAAGPGGWEVFLNLCNLWTVLTYLGFLLVIENPRQLTNRRFGALVALSVMTPSLPLITPLVLFLAAVNRDRRWLWLALAPFPMALINLIGTLGVSSLLNPAGLAQVPGAITYQGIIRLLVIPIFGADLSQRLFTEGPWVTLAAALAPLLVIVSLSRVQRREPWLLVPAISYLSVALSFGGIILIRKYAANAHAWPNARPEWNTRYSFLPWAFALMTWLSLISAGRSQDRPLPKALAGGAIAVLLGQVLWQWPIHPGRPDRHWPAAAARIQEALDRRDRGDESNLRIEVPLQPPVWFDGKVDIDLGGKR